MKRKLNWVSVGNMVGLISGVIYILDTMYYICIIPFMTKRIISLTTFGFITLIIAIVVVGLNFVYFEERLRK